MIEHIALGFFMSTTGYLWYVNYGLIKTLDVFVEASAKLIEATKKE